MKRDFHETQDDRRTNFTFTGLKYSASPDVKKGARFAFVGILYLYLIYIRVYSSIGAPNYKRLLYIS